MGPLRQRWVWNVLSSVTKTCIYTMMVLWIFWYITGYVEILNFKSSEPGNLAGISHFVYVHPKLIKDIQG